MNPTLSMTSAAPSPLEPIELSLVVPCFNEAEKIESVVRNWVNAIAPFAECYEVILINDGSSDGTGRILDRLRRELKSLRVIHQLNFGHAKAVRRGYEVARGRFVLQIDGNGFYDSREFGSLWEKRNAYDLILCDRSAAKEGYFRRGIARALGWWAGLLFKNKLKDPNSPFRLFRREVSADFLAALPERTEGINFCLSIMCQESYPDRVLELPAPLKVRSLRRSRSRATDFFRASLPVFFDLLSLKLRGGRAGITASARFSK